MRFALVLSGILATALLVSAGETLFTAGPHEHEGTKYYWLAEWKLEVTLPADIADGDRLETLFGSKGPAKRTLHFDYNDRKGSMAEVRNTRFEWIAVPLGKLEPGKKVVLYGKGRDKVGFIAGVRIAGKSSAPLKVKPIRVAGSSTGMRSAGNKGNVLYWSDLSGFEMNDQMRSLWYSMPGKPDWQRAERSSRYAGIALDKVQRWPRMNAVPEWFTVEPDDEHRYRVENVDESSGNEFTGKSLATGLPVKLEPNKPLRLIVRPLAP